jgi:glyoxylase-like metal-dependent hydrolase (beta-lactamase superfamily II)
MNSALMHFRLPLAYNEIISLRGLLMTIDKIVVGQLDVNCYVIHEENSSEAVVIDPGDEFDRIAGLLDRKGLTPKYLLLTHAHYDHVCAVGELKEKYGAAIVMHEDEMETYRMTKNLCISWGFAADDFPHPDMLVKDGDKIFLGNNALEVLHTPGHTPGSICLYQEGTLFTGDTLFRGSVGRTDLPGGNTARLLNSMKRLVTLPADTRVFCGHGDETTMGEELLKNPFLSGSRLRFAR